MRLSSLTLFLTLGYFALWVGGPLLFTAGRLWHGLPIWFWWSGIFAPLSLILLLLFLRLKQSL